MRTVLLLIVFLGTPALADQTQTPALIVKMENKSTWLCKWGPNNNAMACTPLTIPAGLKWKVCPVVIGWAKKQYLGCDPGV